MLAVISETAKESRPRWSPYRPSASSPTPWARLGPFGEAGARQTQQVNNSQHVVEVSIVQRSGERVPQGEDNNCSRGWPRREPLPSRCGALTWRTSSNSPKSKTAWSVSSSCASTTPPPALAATIHLELVDRVDQLPAGRLEPGHAQRNCRPFGLAGLKSRSDLWGGQRSRTVRSDPGGKSTFWGPNSPTTTCKKVMRAKARAAEAP